VKASPAGTALRCLGGSRRRTDRLESPEAQRSQKDRGSRPERGPGSRSARRDRLPGRPMNKYLARGAGVRPRPDVDQVRTRVERDLKLLDVCLLLRARAGEPPSESSPSVSHSFVPVINCARRHERRATAQSRRDALAGERPGWPSTPESSPVVLVLAEIAEERGKPRRAGGVGLMSPADLWRGIAHFGTLHAGGGLRPPYAGAVPVCHLSLHPV